MVFLTLRADEYEILQLAKLFILFQSHEKHCTLKVMWYSFMIYSLAQTKSTLKFGFYNKE